MARRQSVETEPPRTGEELAELDVAVALDARVRRAAERMGLHIRTDDFLLEVRDKVESVVIQTELLRYAPRVVHVGDGATSGI
jgi:hypothetical protein